MNQFDLSKYVCFFVSKWRLLMIHAIIGSLIAIIYTYNFATSYYKSTVTFLPPSSEGSSLQSLAILSGIGVSSENSFVPENIETIFESTSFRKKIIDKYDLATKYKEGHTTNKLANTLRKLNKSLYITTEELGNLGVTKTISFMMTFEDTNPDTAFEVTRYAYQLLDSAVIAISQENAQRKADFIEVQLTDKKAKLDSLNKQLLAFQKHSNTYNAEAQMEVTYSQLTSLKTQELMLQLELDNLKENYSDNHPSVIESNSRLTSISKKIKLLVESDDSSSLSLSLNKNAAAMPTFVSIGRDIEIQNALIVFLSQSLEEARINQVRAISKLTTIDPPFKPEYKFKPGRASLMMTIFIIYNVLISLYIFLTAFYSFELKGSKLFNDIIKAIK